MSQRVCPLLPLHFLSSAQCPTLAEPCHCLQSEVFTIMRKSKSIQIHPIIENSMFQCVFCRRQILQRMHVSCGDAQLIHSYTEKVTHAWHGFRNGAGQCSRTPLSPHKTLPPATGSNYNMVGSLTCANLPRNGRDRIQNEPCFCAQSKPYQTIHTGASSESSYASYIERLQIKK